ncbi:MAG TPA: YbgF trimerization domain-containing protein, partial [Fontimonas sp.]
MVGCAGGYGGPISGGSDNLSPTERRLQAAESRVAELSRRLDAVNLTGMDQENLRLRDDLRQVRGEMERLRYEFDQAQRAAKEQYLDLDRRLQGAAPAAGAAGYGQYGGGQPQYGGQQYGAPPAVATVQSGGTLATPQAPAQPTYTPPAYTQAQQVPPGGQPAPVTISNGGGASPEEEGAYLTAFDSLKNGKYDDAITGFRSLLSRWPQGRYADNALYWSGEAYYVKRDYNSALTAFQAVLQRFPSSPKGPDSMLKAGLT